MAFDYFVAEIEGTLKYFRIGTHPLTDDYECYISLDNKTWQLIPHNDNGPLYSEGEKIIQLSFALNPFAAHLRKIELQDLPRDLFHTEDEELEYFEQAVEQQAVNLYREQLKEIQQAQQLKEKPKEDALALMREKLSTDAANKLEKDEEPSSCCLAIWQNMDMTLIGYCLEVGGGLVYLLAMGLLSGVASPVVAGLGIAVMLVGFGLFAYDVLKNDNKGSLDLVSDANLALSQ